MKLIDIINRIDKSERNECYIYIEDLAWNEFDLTIDYVEQDRLKAYWVGNWYCTDTYVGYRVYFLDDEPVCISIQKGRKCDEVFRWFDKSLALKVKDYLLTLVFKEEKEDSFALCDINEDIGEGYKIEFNSQILNSDKATIDGEPIEILERILEEPNYGIDRNLKVRLLNGEEKIVHIKDIEFKYHII